MQIKKYNKYLYSSKDLLLTEENCTKKFKFSINTSKLTSTSLYIVWRAYGDGKDTWVNSNVRINVKMIE